MTRKYKFGDVIENGWAGEGNPLKVGICVEVIHRTGRMNPGQYLRLTDRFGEFWETVVNSESKLTVLENSYTRIIEAEEKVCKLEARIAELEGALKDDWVVEAAQQTLALVLIDSPNLEAFTPSPSGNGYKHKIWMLNQVGTEQITGKKAHRWLGYAQALCVISGAANLKQVKAINNEARRILRGNDDAE